MGNRRSKIIYNSLFTFLIILLSHLCFAQKNKKISPDLISLQTGGGHGLISLSTGYIVGNKDQHFFTIGYGFVPSNSIQKTQHIVHAEYIFWFLESIKINSSWEIFPIGIGNTLSYFFGSQHEGLVAGYPKGYYWFRTDLSSRYFLGTRLDLKLSKGNNIGFSADIGRTLLYSVTNVRNPSLPFFDFMNISFALYFTF